MISFSHELQRESEICAHERSKKNVYIIQFNTPSSRNLMPLAGGLLHSYAQADPVLKDHFTFKIEMVRGAPEAVVQKYHKPAIAAFSLYFWNFNQSIQVMRLLKERHPETLIVIGGPSAPLHEADTTKFFADHPYVDISVPAEGEVIFSEILHGYLKGIDYNTIPGISVRTSDGGVRSQPKRPYIRDISVIPSPFLDGTFDELLERHSQDITGVVWETNRGCPFTCTFCFWGGPDSKVSQFPMERVYAELDWISRNKIAYIFGADANFGIIKRDVEIAKYMAKLNRETGFPKFFVINWTKNATERIFDIVDALKESSLKFMLTTSVQSHNPDTLKAIRRQNIKLESFEKILSEANKRNFNTYSELILGLPLETYTTFANGLRKVLVPVLHYHFNVYCCVLIPGTEMAEPEYVKQYGIQTRRCVMNLGKTVHLDDAIQEYEDLVVSTNTMPVADWRRSHRLAYFTKALYGFRSAFFVLNFLRQESNVDVIDFIEFAIDRALQDPRLKTIRHALQLLSNLQESILNSGNETLTIPGVETSLHAEMAAILALMSDKLSFYRELDTLIRQFAQERQLGFDEDLYAEVLVYQYARMPSWNDRATIETARFAYNIQDYLVGGSEAARNCLTLKFDHSLVYRNPDEFLRQHIYGGMIFSLLGAIETANTVADATSAVEFYKAQIACETIIVNEGYGDAGIRQAQ